MPDNLVTSLLQLHCHLEGITRVVEGTPVPPPASALGSMPAFLQVDRDPPRRALQGVRGADDGSGGGGGVVLAALGVVGVALRGGGVVVSAMWGGGVVVTAVWGRGVVMTAMCGEGEVPASLGGGGMGSEGAVDCSWLPGGVPWVASRLCSLS